MLYKQTAQVSRSKIVASENVGNPRIRWNFLVLWKMPIIETKRIAPPKSRV